MHPAVKKLPLILGMKDVSSSTLQVEVTQINDFIILEVLLYTKHYTNTPLQYIIKFHPNYTLSTKMVRGTEVRCLTDPLLLLYWHNTHYFINDDY